MAFRYALQALLRLRENLERQEEQRLFAIAAVVARLRAEVERFRDDELGRRRLVLSELERDASAALLSFDFVCARAAEEAATRIEMELQEAEQRRLAQLEVYRAARQKREILQGLRHRREAEYELELARHNQQLTDEGFLVHARARSTE